MTRGAGTGKTPERVMELLKKAVAEKSQSEVARESGVAVSKINRYIKGVGEPNTHTLENLADYFGVSVLWLRGEELLGWQKKNQDRMTDEFAELVDDVTELYDIAPPHLKTAVQNFAIFLQIEAEQSLTSWLAGSNTQAEAIHKDCMKSLRDLLDRYKIEKAQGLIPERK